MFNYKKFVFKKFSQAQPAQTQSGKILNELDPNKSTGKILDELDTNKSVDKKVEEQVSARAQEKARSVNNAKRQLGVFEDTFEKLGEALQEVSKDSPFASVEPGNLVKACDSVAKTLNKENTQEKKRYRGGGEWPWQTPAPSQQRISNTLATH